MTYPERNEVENESDVESVECPHCGAAVCDDDLRDHIGGQFCPECEDEFVWSSYEDTYIHQDEVVRVYEGTDRHASYLLVSESTVSDRFYWSDARDRWEYYDYSSEDEDESDEDESDEDAGLIGYHTRKADEAFGFIGAAEGGSRPFWLGVELEFYPDSISEAKAAAAAFGLLCSDGSLNSGGAELVCAPMNLESLYAHLGQFLKQVGGTTDRACGLHIHISKGANTKLGRAKLGSFLNDSQNEWLPAILGREPNRYCKQDSAIKVGRALKGSDRYVVFNTNNAHTDEIRLGDATLDPSELFARIEYVHALTMFVREAALTELSDGHFASWLHKQPKNYAPNLRAMLPDLPPPCLRETPQIGSPYRAMDPYKEVRKELAQFGLTHYAENPRSGADLLCLESGDLSLEEGGEWVRGSSIITGLTYCRTPNLTASTGGQLAVVAVTLGGYQSYGIYSSAGLVRLNQRHREDMAYATTLAAARVGQAWEQRLYDVGLGLSELRYAPRPDRKWFYGTTAPIGILAFTSEVVHLGRGAYTLKTTLNEFRYHFFLNNRKKKARNFIENLLGIAARNAAAKAAAESRVAA